MKITLIIVGVLSVVTFVVLSKFSRFGVESPKYRVIETDGDFEVRDYPEMLVASTPMANSNPQEGTSFMRLFRYISGDNEAGEKIAMTTPVITSRQNGSQEMRFIVPSAVADTGPPKADSDLVELKRMAGGTFAAYRFSGSWDSAKFDNAKTELAEWIEQQKLTPLGEPMIANYDPPYTPSFLKRNEVLIRVEP